MVPKIIHYCWFGNKPIPKSHQDYIDNWRKVLPDYEFVCWNESKIDIDSIPFLRQAYDSKMWAFVADYTRLYALYNYGGIYLDTDVEVLKTLDDFLNHSFFSSVEYHPNYKDAVNATELVGKDGKRLDGVRANKKVPGIGLMSAIMGSEPRTTYIKELMDWYDAMSFEENRRENYTIPTTLAIIAESRGFRYVNEYQQLSEGIVLYPANIFADFRTSDKDSVAIHHCEASWLPSYSLFKRLLKYLFQYRLIRKIYFGIRNMFSSVKIDY